MKILLSPDYFTPEVFSSSYLFDNRNKAFVDNGFTIACNTPYPTRGIDEEIRRQYINKKVEYLYEGGMKVRRFPMYREGKNSGLRALRYLLASIMQFLLGIREKDVDVIFMGSTPPFQGAMGGLLKKIKKCHLVYAMQDIFPDSLVSTGITKKGSLMWKIGRAIENFTYRNADKIIVISEDFKKNIIAKGVPEEKIVVIYNWVEEDAVVDVPRKDNVLFDRYGLDRSKFYITYNGNIGLTQNMEMLMEVAKELEINEDIHFVLVGNGAYKDNLEQIIKDRAIRNVTMIPFQPYEEISHVFSLGDVSLVISKPGVGANSVPSKTWSIMSASRPVLANFDENELKTIIEENNCGIFTKAGDKVAFTDAILKLYNNRELCREMGKNGRQFVMNNLTKAVGTKKYVDVINSLETK